MYVLGNVDNLTSKSDVFFLKTLEKLPTNMKDYLALSDRVTDRRLQSIRSDGAGEHMDSIFVALKCPEGVY